MGKFIPPDWRDEYSYPANADDWSAEVWAWEFLRRNPEYQKDYEHFDKLPSYQSGGKSAKWYRQSGEWWHSVELRYCKHSILPDDDTVLEYVNRTGDRTPYEYSLEDHLIEKWGIEAEQIYDPSYECANIHLDYYPNLPKRIKTREYDFKKNETVSIESEPENDFEVTLRFDIRHSIDKQLIDAKEILQIIRYNWSPLHDEMIRHSSGIQMDKLPIYLRVYDAKQAGITYVKIGEELYSDEALDLDNAKQRAYNAFKKAEELVQGGYRELIKQAYYDNKTYKL